MSGSATGDRLPLSGRLLAIDLGDVRVGLAVSDPDQVIAAPEATVAMAPSDDDVTVLAERLAAEAARLGAAGLVIGDPRDLDGTVGPRAHHARAVAAALRTASDLPVALWDERFTTSEAERVLLAADVSRRGRRAVVDRVAASVLLQAVLTAQGRRRAAGETDRPGAAERHGSGDAPRPGRDAR